MDGGGPDDGRTKTEKVLTICLIVIKRPLQQFYLCLFGKKHTIAYLQGKLRKHAREMHKLFGLCTTDDVATHNVVHTSKASAKKK